MHANTLTCLRLGVRYRQERASSNTLRDGGKTIAAIVSHCPRLQRLSVPAPHYTCGV